MVLMPRLLGSLPWDLPGTTLCCVTGTCRVAAWTRTQEAHRRRVAEYMASWRLARGEEDISTVGTYDRSPTVGREDRR